jgi:FAD/FMN-containing dehydrogenase
MSPRRIRNWDGTQSWKPEAIYYPEDEEQIAKLIQLASEKQKRIKAVGEALSWSDIIDVPETAIRFDKMSKELRELYPAYDEFDRLRRRCDPNGLFRNSFLDRVFPAR